MTAEEPTWTLRPARPGDAARLAEFGAATFAQAFGSDNDPTDLEQHLEASFGTPQQTAQIEDPDYRTLLATRSSVRGEEELVGYAQLRRSIPPDCVAVDRPVQLLRFYVIGAAHGRGLAQELMAAAVRTGVALGGQHLWLSVWEKNPRAIAFYAKEGFTDVGSADFWVGSDRQTDRILLREIEEA
ncbi:MAG: GNAT family N-acetyltransferase [Acidobacteriota bacterium]